MAAVNMTEVPVLHGDNSFPIRVVGTSHHRDAIARLAVNEGDGTRLHFLPLLLFPYDTNAYDPKAVAVMALGTAEQLGHLPTKDAKRYRERAAELDINGPAICGAVLSDGMRQGNVVHDFAIQLDVDLERPLTLTDAVPFRLPERLLRMEWVRRVPNGLNEVRCWLSEPASILINSWRVIRWQRPEWSQGGYYAERRQGGGYGLRLFGIDVTEERALFGGGEVEAEIMAVDGRWATVYLEGRRPGVPSSRRRWTGGRPVRQLYLLREQLVEERLAIDSAKDSAERIARTRRAQETQYLLAECGNRKDVDGTLLKEQAGMNWDLLTTPYIQIIVRGLVEVGQVEEARSELDRFCQHAPHQRGGRVISALEKNIAIGKVSKPRRPRKRD